MAAGDNDEVKVGVWTLLKVYLRSFFAQGSFSVKDRQNVGFAFCMEPVARRLYTDKEKRRTFAQRHVEYYNGNPFMAPLVFGAVSRMEEDFRNGRGISEEDIVRFKRAVGPATGSVGDRFFWRTLRPFALGVGLLVEVLNGTMGLIVFLLAFNLPAQYLRLRWLFAGYRLGPRVVIEIRNPKLDIADRIMECAGAFILSFIATGFLGRQRFENPWLLLGTVAIFFFSAFMLKHKQSLKVSLLTSVGLAILLGLSIYSVG